MYMSPSQTTVITERVCLLQTQQRQGSVWIQSERCHPRRTAGRDWKCPSSRTSFTDGLPPDRGRSPCWRRTLAEMPRACIRSLQNIWLCRGKTFSYWKCIKLLKKPRWSRSSKAESLWKGKSFNVTPMCLTFMSASLCDQAFL